jgi:hypothetical protein
MAIQVKVGEEAINAADVKSEKSSDNLQEKVEIKLNARRTLAGDVMVFDHDDIDIVLMTRKNKIVTFAKESFGEQVYEAQNRLFNYLVKKGIIEHDSIQGGNIYSAMEAKLQESKEYNVLNHALLCIEGFIAAELPYAEYEKAYEREQEERLTEPLPDESTELDPDRHSDKKGSVRPMIQYGISSIYRL